jgi:hypothetical protein
MVIVQAPGWSAKRFSPAQHCRSLSSRRLARSARSVHDVMEGHVVTRQRPERVAGCDPTWCGGDGPPTNRLPLAYGFAARGTLAVVVHSVPQREPSGGASQRAWVRVPACLRILHKVVVRQREAVDKSPAAAVLAMVAPSARPPSSAPTATAARRSERADGNGALLRSTVQVCERPVARTHTHRHTHTHAHT